MKRTIRSALLWAIACAVATSVYLLGVEVTPYLSSMQGSVPSPVQSGNVRLGDHIYYLSTAREFAELDWPPEAPTNTEARTYERARIIPIAIAALPYFLTDDTRLVLLLNYVLIAFGLAIPACYTSRLITRRPAVAAALTLLALTYAVVWSAMPYYVDPLGRNLSALANAALHAASWLTDPPDKFALGDHFRVVQPSLSIPFSLAFILVILKLRSLETATARAAWSTLAVALGVILCLTYTPVTVASYLFLVSAAGAALLLREWRSFATYLIVGVSILALLALLGIPQFVVSEMASSPLISRLYPTSNLLDLQPSLAVVWRNVSNKYLVLSLLLLPFAFVSRENRFAILMLSTMSALLTLTHIFVADQSLVGRMGRRAADLPWLLLYLSIVAAVALDVSADLRGAAWGRRLALAVWLVLMAIPVSGQIRSVVVEHDRQAYRLAADDYAMLNYLKENYADDTLVATLDWRLIQLIGMFTDLDPAVSDIGLSARPPELEMPRLMGLYKALGFPRDIYLDDVRRSVENVARLVRPYQEANRSASAAPYRQTPFIDWKDFRSSSISGNVLRTQNLSQYAGIKTLEDGGLSPELIQRLSLDWDSAPECAPWILSDVRLVLWDSNTSPPLDWKCPGRLIAVRQYGTLALYALNGVESASGNRP